jgi:hypothetical protein
MKDIWGLALFQAARFADLGRRSTPAAFFVWTTVYLSLSGAAQPLPKRK